MTLASLRRLLGLLGPAALLLLGCGRDPIAQGTGTGTGDGGSGGGSSASDGGDTDAPPPPCGTVQLADIARGEGGFALDGEAANDHSGRVVSGAGDVNGDGLDDVIVGASGADVNDRENSGRTYVVFGRADGGTFSLAAVAEGTGGFALDGEAARDGSGAAISGAGDVNGDGLADAIVGANGADVNGRQASGRSYVVFGTTQTGTASLADVAGGTGGFALDGESANDASGASVSGAGDVNGDGLDDVIVGAPGADPNGEASGRAYVVFGREDITTASLTDVAGGIGGFVVDGEAESHQPGRFVAGAGDVNGDGLADVIVGLGTIEPMGSGPRRAYVVFGKADTAAVSLADVAQGMGGFALDGELAGECYDTCNLSVSGAGDVNGDGLADVIVGAPGADLDDLDHAGRAYVVFGKADTDGVSLADVAQGSGGFAMDGEARGDYSGRSVSGAGDINGDGLADVIVGADGADPNGHWSGRSHVVFGKTSTEAVALADVAQGIGGFALAGEAEGDHSGDSVSSAGDVNGDGIPDLLVGADGADPNGPGSGRTYVVFGFACTDSGGEHADGGPRGVLEGSQSGRSR